MMTPPAAAASTPAEQSVQSETAIEIRNISVAFRAYHQRPTSLKETALNIIRKRKVRYYSTFDALSNVSLTIKRGQVFGIIGSNGAGKSTLLRVMAGVLKPTIGEVIINGKIDSLIQLGAGFDSDLNAIENIILNGSLYQKTPAQMRERVDPIVEFAELGEFAYTPIKYYSSGMSARLGFSVAIDRDPDILLVDEVLGVGDERFQAKCRKVFEGYLARGKTIVMVTHSADTIAKMTHETAVLSKGQIVFCGPPAEALKVYRDAHYQTRLG